MKKIIFLIIAALLAAGCSKTPQSGAFPALSSDEITAERVWKRFTVEEDYRKYPHWPDYNGFQPGQSPHGRVHKVYISPLLREALPLPGKVVPNGSIIVKENYTADKVLAAYTVMVKVRDYDPENQDWFWAKYNAEGKVLAEGKLKGCADCHAGSRGNDNLILWQLDRPLE